MRLVNLEDMKKKLVGTAERDVVPYSALLEASQGMGLVRSADEAQSSLASSTMPASS